MLLQHSAFYSLARGVPGLINFLAIVVYTRLMNPDSYGNYALVVAAVGFFASVFFRWLGLGLLRFFPAHKKSSQELLSVIFCGFFIMVLITAFLGLIVYFSWPYPSQRTYFKVAVALIWGQAWFELNLILVQSQLRPLRYGLISVCKATLSLALGTSLIIAGFEAFGPLLGLLIASVFTALAFAGREWRGIRIRTINRGLFVGLLQYGLPLTITFALTFAVASSDRFMLAWFLGTEAVGLYAPGYDLAHQSLTMMMMVVNLAAYPLAIRALEENGEKAARKQLESNILLLLSIGFPAATGFAMCASNIADVAVGPAYRQTVSEIIPWISVAALVSGIKSYFLDLSFQLGKYTIGQIWVTLLAAGVNIGLNLWWIPLFGLMGAAYATLVSYSVGFIHSYILGRRRAFRLPPFPKDSIKVVIASLIMAIALSCGFGSQGWLPLLGKIVLGCFVYGLVFLVLNIAGCRKILKLPF